MTEQVPASGDANEGNAGSDASAALVRVVGGLVAAAAARKLVSALWVAAAGRRPPHDPEDPQVDAKEAMAFAVVSGVIAGAAQMVVMRRAAAIKAGRAGAKAARAEKRLAKQQG
jgi:hypothetical protein